MSGYPTYNRPDINVQRSNPRDAESLFAGYEHLQGLPRGDAALVMLRKVASMVKPIMRKRGWKVQVLAEFLPPEPTLLGLNINRGWKICIRLRYHHNPDLFLPVEEVCDTMLHELSHNVWGPHDSNFHALWDELRDEHETLVMKGFTGEGFLSDGHVLGGARRAPLPPQEMRRLARASAENRQKQNKLTKGSGQRLGGTPLHLQGGDVRRTITNQITRRNNVNKGCASGRDDANQLSQQSADHTFKTKAEEDDANDRAIAQALYDLIEQEEERKLQGTFSTSPTDGGLAWHPDHGLYDPTQGRKAPTSSGHQLNTLSEEEQLRWAVQESMGRKRDPSDEVQVVSSRTPNLSVKSKPSLRQPRWALQESMGHNRDPSDEVQIVSPLTPDLSVKSKPSLRQPMSRSSSPPAPSSSRSITRSFGTTHVSPISNTSSHGRNSSLAATSPTSAVSGPVIMDISEPFNPDQWTCEICTCINPLQFLACDACATSAAAATAAHHHNKGLELPKMWIVYGPQVVDLLRLRDLEGVFVITIMSLSRHYQWA